MKHILTKIAFGAALVLGASSCNMELRPYSVIDPDNALETYEDAQNLANGFNVQIRSLASGALIYSPELQSDLFHAVQDFGNRGGSLYRWEFTASEGIFESAFGACYSAIGSANYFIEKANNIFKRVESDAAFAETWTDEELALLQGHMSEAYFLKAYAYSILVDKFCPAYDPETADDDDTGIPIVDVYNPTPDKSTYPGRATLEESFDEIYENLDNAEEFIGNVNKPAAGSNYITVDAVYALRARVALMRQDYATAMEETQKLIGATSSHTYSLQSGEAALQNLWVNDSQPREVILQCFASKPDELPSSSNYGYIGYNVNLDQYTPDFVPEQSFIDLFTESDYRKAVYFDQQRLTFSTGETEPLLIFNKFPGNPSLSVSDKVKNYCNAPKPFRIAEIYLIAAEAYYYMGMNKESAEMINALKSSRIANYVDPGLASRPDELLQQIKEERIRELAGEGFRISDLKRYGDGMQRGEPQETSIVSRVPSEELTVSLNVEAGNYRFVWAIPQVEIDANPQIKQNKGYTN